MDAIDKIKAHFQAQIDGGLKKVSVPEWGIDIYYGPETIEQRDYYWQDIAANKNSGFAKLIVERARTEDGKRLFSRAQLVTFLKNSDPEIVANVAAKIFADSAVTDEDAGKS